MIGIIDYGMSNLKSVQNAFDFLQCPNQIFTNPTEIKKYDKLILPGVGAFGLAMEKLNITGFSDEIKEYVLAKNKPFMGICLGMQLMLDSSVEKGFNKGLGLINGEVRFLGDQIKNMPIPHVGWNTVLPQNDSMFFKEIDKNDPTFYFVHSFYCDVFEKKIVSGTVNYGFNFDFSI